LVISRKTTTNREYFHCPFYKYILYLYVELIFSPIPPEVSISILEYFKPS